MDPELKINIIGGLTILLGPFIAIGIALLIGWLFGWNEKN